MFRRIVAIGPGNTKHYFSKIHPLSVGEYKKQIAILADNIAREGIELGVLPDKGAYLDLAIEVKKRGGRVIGLVPFDDKIWGINHIRHNMELKVNGTPLFDEFINTGDWFKTDETITLYGDATIVLGHSPGAIRELSSGIYLYKLIVGVKKEAKIRPEEISEQIVVRPGMRYYILNYLPLSGAEIYPPLKAHAEDYGIHISEIADVTQLQKLIKQS